jgi:toxin ParE1/3/4
LCPLQVRWREEAEQDACDVALYIAGDNPGAAARFLDSVGETIRMLAELPGTGRDCFFDGLDLRGIRSRQVRGFENWLVFFRSHEAGSIEPVFNNGPESFPCSAA